jgi:hypothetical protein
MVITEHAEHRPAGVNATPICTRYKVESSNETLVICRHDIFKTDLKYFTLLILADQLILYTDYLLIHEQRS